jgi:hypothetical protein
MTSYTNIFGGNVVLPADVSYRKIELTEDETLVWTNSFSDSTKIVAHIMEVDVKEPEKKIFLPNATKVSVGTAILFMNISISSFTLCDFNKNVLIQDFNQGIPYYYYLTENDTPQGSWRGIQLGGEGKILNGITSVSANVTGKGLTIGGSPITTPGGTLTFELDTLLQQLATFAQEGNEAGLMCFDPTNNQCSTKSLVAGKGIKIDNPRGVDGAPTISFDESILPGEGITTINMAASTPAVVITGSPGKAPTADFGIGVHDSLQSLYQVAVRDESGDGFVTRYSSSSPYYIRRTLEAGNGILIQNEDGAGGNPSFAIDPAIVPAKGSVIESIRVIGDVAVSVSGSPLKGANPTLTLNSDVDVKALAAGDMINHKQIPVAAGGWVDGRAYNSLNVLNVVKRGNEFDISFISSNIRNRINKTFFSVMTNVATSWNVVKNGIVTETSTLSFVNPNVDFSFLVWLI